MTLPATAAGGTFEATAKSGAAPRKRPAPGALGTAARGRAFTLGVTPEGCPSAHNRRESSMAASTTVDLSPVEREIVIGAVLDELQTMAQNMAETVQYDPIEPGHVMDVRWKYERLGVCLTVLEDLGFIDPRSSKDRFAGTLLTADGEVR